MIDPLFYLHHAGVDRLWETWQRAAFGRLYAVNGPSTYPAGSAQVHLDFVLEYPGLAPSVKVRDVMDILHRPSCYHYDELM